MTESATVAIVQLDSSDGEPVAHRVDRVLGLTADAARGSDLVVLPELWHIGAFATDKVVANSEPIDGPLVTAFSVLARECRVWLHAGSFAERAADGRHFNTSVLLAPDGRLVTVYRKIHLFGFTGGETTVMSAGEHLVVVPTVLGETGLATCYDLRFPELFRALLDRSATTLLIASGWPTARIEHWSLLTRARAIENQMFVVACNGVGTQSGVTLGGHSVVVDPTGEVVAEAGDTETVLRAELDLPLLSRWRATFPVLPDRRPGLY
jgi:predicted amidohydrolase